MSDDQRLTRIEDKIDRVVDRIGSIDVTLSAQHESLKEHMRRTEILERQIEPLNKHVNMIDGVLKFLGVLALVGTLAITIAKVFGH